MNVHWKRIIAHMPLLSRIRVCCWSPGWRQIMNKWLLTPDGEW